MRTFLEFINSGSFSNSLMKDIGFSQSIEKNLTKLPYLTLNIPTKIVENKIQCINYTKNPIEIVLENGICWKVTRKQWEYLVHSGKEPKKGIKVQLEMFLSGQVKSINLI